MATHSSILAWRIPWTEEPGRLQSMGMQRVRHDWGDLACMHSHIQLWSIALVQNGFLRWNWLNSNSCWSLTVPPLPLLQLCPSYLTLSLAFTTWLCLPLQSLITRYYSSHAASIQSTSGPLRHSLCMVWGRDSYSHPYFPFSKATACCFKCQQILSKSLLCAMHRNPVCICRVWISFDSPT